MKNCKNNMKKFIKQNRLQKEKGITLVALTVTIIIIIILAGVAFTSITGEGGLIKQARKNSENVQRESIIEKIEADLFKEKSKTGNTPSKEDLKSIIQENEYNQGELGEESFVTKDGEYTINYDEIIGWKEKEEENPIDPSTPGIDKLKVGDYVDYIDQAGNTIKCITLYDEEYNQNNKTDYGVQIIAKDVVDTVTLGDENLEKSINSYNNALKILYSKAQEYLNSTYASSARCVGSKPDDPDWDTNEMFEPDSSYTYLDEFKNKLIVDDSNRLTDLGQLMSSEEIKGDSSFWLASRISVSMSSMTYFDIFSLDESGITNKDYLCLLTSSGSRQSDVCNNGFRPVFTLKPEVKLIGGNGTEENPYTLGV